MINKIGTKCYWLFLWKKEKWLDFRYENGHVCSKYKEILPKIFIWESSYILKEKICFNTTNYSVHKSFSRPGSSDLCRDVRK